MTHPVDYQKGQDKDKVNYINPLCYIRRIMYNLSGVGVRREGYIGEEIIFRDSGNLAFINEGPA
jgi:hypothetical protein